MAQLLTQKDLAERWQMSVKSIEEYRKAGIIPTVEGIPAIRFNLQTILELEGTKLERFSPLERRRMEMELDRWVGTLLQKEEPYICFHNDTGNYRILLKNISYIETYNRNLLIHTAEQNIVCYWKMKDMESKIVSYGFSRNHSSYIVNLFYVENIEKNEVKLSTGERLPISKTKKKEFMEDIAEYWGNLV